MGRLRRMTDGEIRAWVNGLLAGTIFTSDMVEDDQALPRIFMGLAAGDLQGWSEGEINEIGCIWQHTKHATHGYMVDGCPVFTRNQYMHRDDHEACIATADAERRRRDVFEIIRPAPDPKESLPAAEQAPQRKPNPCLDPDAMHGACDGMGGEDYFGQ